jgi:Peptidase family S41
MMRKKRVQKNSPKKVSAIAHQRGKSLPEALGEVPSDIATLNWGERLDIIDAWAQVLDGVYAHLPLKRALYGFDPIRAIEYLRQQVPSLTDLQFHRELTSLINRLRDAHTQYSGPQSIAGAVAALPFLVEAWGPVGDSHYVVSKVSNRRLINDPHFTAGVTLTFWNGVPFDRAVDLHADSETGGRPDARQARALDSLTFRSLEYGPPPDEHWIDIGYIDLKKKKRETRMPWRVVCPNRAPSASNQGGSARMRRGIDPAAEAVRRAKKLMFNAALWAEERPAAASPTASRSLTEKYKDFLTARKVDTSNGRFGYLRIWSFDVDDDQEFIEAAIRLLAGMPNRGLIIDLRDNPGGLIWAAERMLQLFTPSHIEPTKFGMRATSLTNAMASARFNQGELGPWADSIASAPSTGEPYSTHLPITTVEQCNDLGQHYGGPIVVIVNANTYSSGDLFAAGIVDNHIAPVICIGEATGAGGANVWTSDDLSAAMKAAGFPLPALANGANFTMAMRRAVRSGDATGMLIEDTGIAGQSYAMTQRDIFKKNIDLIEYCGKLLSGQPLTQLNVVRSGRSLRITTAGLDHLDVYADGHPAGPGFALKGNGTIRVPLPQAADAVEVVGFSQNAVRQRRKLSSS